MCQHAATQPQGSVQAPWWWSKTETFRIDIYVHFNVNFNLFFLINKSAFVGEKNLHGLRQLLMLNTCVRANSLLFNTDWDCSTRWGAIIFIRWNVFHETRHLAVQEQWITYPPSFIKLKIFVEQMLNILHKFHHTMCVCNEVVPNIDITFIISHVPWSKTSQCVCIYIPTTALQLNTIFTNL